MKNFFRMNYPYYDFAIIQSDDFEEHLLDDMLCKKINKNTYVLSFNDLVQKDSITGNYYGFSGYIADEDGFFYGSIEKPIDFNMPRTGKYTYFECVNEREVVISTDYFGQSVLYRAKIGQTAIVSNRIHLLALVIKKINSTITLNKSVLLRKLFYNIYNENSYQNQIDETLVSEIRKIPVGKKVFISNGFIKEENESLISLISNDFHKGFYDAHLDNGVKELRGAIRNVIQSSLFQEIVVPISGGKDSRLMLSAVMTSGADLSKIYGRTYKTKSILDDKIAIKIQRDLGIKNHRKKKDFTNYKVVLDIEDTLNLYTSFFGGAYTLLNAGGASSLGFNHCKVNFVGTSSNVLRAGAANTLSNHFPNLDQMDIKVFCRNFHNKFGLHKVFEKRIAEEVYVDLERFYIKTPGDSLVDKLEYSHMNVGSRFHGGQASIMHSWNDSPFLNIMLMPSLFMAAKSLPLSSRMEGHLFYDFVVKAMADLAAYNYDSKFPYAEEKTERLGFNKVYVDKNYDTSEYFLGGGNINHFFLPKTQSKFNNNDLLLYLSKISNDVIESIASEFLSFSFLREKPFIDFIQNSFRGDGEYAKRAILTLMAVKLLLID